MNKETKQNADLNYNYYRKNLNEISRLYNNKYIIIQNQKIISYDPDRSKIVKHSESLDAGTFIILKIR